MDYYGKLLATCSSDKLIRVFEVDGNNHRLLQTLKGHEGPVWQVAWSHPKFGSLIASCSYDGKVIIWKETNKAWSIIKEYKGHESSVNSISWAPSEFGLALACASSDGNISVLTYKDDGTWSSAIFLAHQIGCNAVSWFPVTYTALFLSKLPANTTQKMRLASGGCDNMIRLWSYNVEASKWEEDGEPLEGHSDWVRDVAFAPNIGLSITTLASCSEDKKVIIWNNSPDKKVWEKKELPVFADAVWRLSWSVTGNILAVSCADNKITLWKESLKGEWERISEIDENLK